MHEVIDLCNDAESDADDDIVELSPAVFAITVKQERRTPSRLPATPNSLAPNRQGVLHPDLVARNRMLSTKRSIPLSEGSNAKRRRLQPHASTRTQSSLLTQEGRAGTSSCISLLSDEEEASVPRIKTENVGNSLCSSSPQRTVELESNAEDDGFLDLNDPNVWDPLVVNLEKMDHCEETNYLSESFEPVETPPQRHPDMSKSHWPPITTDSKKALYERINLYRPHNIRSVLPRRRQVICRPTSMPLDFGVHLSRLKLRASFKEAPGSINKIEQKGGWTIIASACIGGNFDDVYDEYNRPGSLMTWHNGFQILPGHQTTVEKTRGGEGLGHVAKQNTVNDVKFDPLSSSFVSSGTDHTVQVWNLQGQCYRKGVKLGQYISTPYDIVFKPGTSTLAIGERKLFIFRLEEETSISAGSSLPPAAAFEISPPGIDSNVGAMVWGSGPTDRCLFASSEPIDTDEFVGCHRIFDVGRNSSAIIDAKEAGDALCIDPFGKNLFLATRGSIGRNILRRYDVRTGTAKKTAEFDLDRFPTNTEGEINDSACSPDGIYLALARNDNHIHVYDCRMFRSARNVLYDYSHDAPSYVAPGYHSYGVVKAQWVTTMSGKLGLVSGGADGCVRLWDPLRAAESKKNGIILAEVNSDVAHFSLGDHFKGEHQLIVGDCRGEVSIFDRVW